MAENHRDMLTNSALTDQKTWKHKDILSKSGDKKKRSVVKKKALRNPSLFPPPAATIGNSKKCWPQQGSDVAMPRQQIALCLRWQAAQICRLVGELQLEGVVGLNLCSRCAICHGNILYILCRYIYIYTYIHTHICIIIHIHVYVSVYYLYNIYIYNYIYNIHTYNCTYTRIL